MAAVQQAPAPANVTEVKVTEVKTTVKDVQEHAKQITTGDHLHIIDSRTMKKYDIPIDGNFIRGSDIRKITIADEIGESILQKPLAVFDPGYENTAAMESSITHIDGVRGTIKFRGVPIEQLFHNNDYEEVIYLLINGNLPNNEEKLELRKKLAKAATPPQHVRDVIRAMPPTADTISMLTAGLSAYAATDVESIECRHLPAPKYWNNARRTDNAVLKTIAYVATVVALAYCHKFGKEFVEPSKDKTIIQNLLSMMSVNDPDGRIEKCWEQLWILYADHEMSCSTAAFLHSASTLTDPVSCAVSAMVAGAGPLHAGAIELVYDGLERLGSVDNVPAYIDAVKAKQFRLFGYGHRVYKTKDPRATLIEGLMENYPDEMAANPLLQIAMAIDKQANTDEYFVSRKLKVNADLLGCFLYTALGIEREIIPSIVFLSRCPGILAHWKEAMSQPIKIWRPTQKWKEPAEKA